jgi:hypothetical protein
VISERWNQLLFGFKYPPEHYWRPTLALLLLFVAAAPVLFFDLPRKLLIFTGLYPFIAFWLIWGGTIWSPIFALLGFVAGYAVYSRFVKDSFAMGFFGGVVAALLTWWVGGFIGPALAPLLLVPMLWARGNALLDNARRRPLAAGLVVVSVLGAISILVTWFIGWGPAAEVVSYGIEILTIGASGIYADEVIPRVAALATVVLTLTIALRSRGRARSVRLVALIGPTLGAGLLYLGLRTAAVALTGGELGYAGTKLLYGVITLAIILGLVPLTGLVSRLHIAPSIGISVLVLGLSSSVMLGVRALPTDTELGASDRQVQEFCNMLRDDIASSSTITYQKSGNTVRITMEMIPTGVTGAHTHIGWEFIGDANTIRRRLDARSYEIITTDMDQYRFASERTDSTIHCVHLMFRFDNTIQRYFELFIQTPYGPELK